MKLVSILALPVFFSCLLTGLSTAHASPPTPDRATLEAGVRTEISKDLALPYKPKEELVGRTCLDGRAVSDFGGDIIEYWANLECSWCGIREPLQAQRENPDICIVVRHVPSSRNGESLKKALSFEALKIFSVNAAHQFWDSILPKTAKDIPVPYESAMLLAFQEAAIDPEAFSDALAGEIVQQVSSDMLAARGRISATPTFVLEGIRFPACDFKADQLPEALDLARKARNGDAEAQSRIIRIISNGLMNEKLL